MRFNSAVPICHVPMTNKQETLYTEVFEWLKEQCPLLKPKNINMDFELAEMNSAKAIFGISPTGCDFHYNQAILRKIGKKGLKKTLGKNPEFKKWVYQIMALNHLPGDKIEAAFRELCSRQFPLSATAKRARESFERYWERFWLNTIGVERLSVYYDIQYFMIYVKYFMCYIKCFLCPIMLNINVSFEVQPKLFRRPNFDKKYIPAKFRQKIYSDRGCPISGNPSPV